MTKLGEILLDRGIVSVDELRSALDACRRNGGRLGTWLVRLGYLSEGALLDALTVQTGCPGATAADLSGAPSELRSLLPAGLAKRHMAIAFRRKGQNLDVAMVNPNDLMVVDEISSVTRMVVRPFVATETALAAALAIPATSAVAPPARNATPAVREWRQFWRLDSPPPELFRALDAGPLPAPSAHAAMLPSLAPLTEGEIATDRGEDLGELLATSNHRDQIATHTLDHLARLASRVALFSLHQNKVMGWAARGDGIVAEDFSTLILPLDRPSAFLNVSRGVELHAGPLPGGEGNELLLEALGAPVPDQVVIAPLRLRTKLAGFLWLDNGTRPISDIPLAEVRETVRLVGLALEVLVMRHKIRSAGRLTDGAGAD